MKTAVFAALALAACLAASVQAQSTCACRFLPPRDCSYLTLVDAELSTCSRVNTQCTACQCDPTGSFTCNLVDTDRYSFTDDSETTCALTTSTAVVCPSTDVTTFTCSNDQQLPWGGFSCVLTPADFPTGATVNLGELTILQSSTATLSLENAQEEPVTGTITVSVENDITSGAAYFSEAWPNEQTEPFTTTLQPASSSTFTATQVASDVNIDASNTFLTDINAMIAAGTGSVTVTFNVAFLQTIGSFEGGVTQAFSAATFLFAFQYTN
mmetsp:Transcript_3493/g.9579  ORF Transcript_3493/g.9579 Transcript_3493/m.9579 type:complete len:269 (-) Transcript_3493:174-980(-)